MIVIHFRKTRTIRGFRLHPRRDKIQHRSHMDYPGHPCRRLRGTADPPRGPRHPSGHLRLTVVEVTRSQRKCVPSVRLRGHLGFATIEMARFFQGVLKRDVAKGRLYSGTVSFKISNWFAPTM